MVSVDDEKFCMHITESGKMKFKNGTSVGTFEDDSFMDSINWDSISSNRQFLKDQGTLFPIGTTATSPKLRTEAGSPIVTPPTPVLAVDRDKDYPDTYHHYPMTKITETLFLGNDHDARDEDALKKAKITHVLSMIARKWTNKPRGLFNWKSKGVKRKCAPMRDDGKSDVVKLLGQKRLWKFILKSQQKQNKLLIHCQMGMNRSPTIVMGFLMKYNHITFYKAWRLVKQKRDIVQPHVKYIKQLRAWDMYLHGKYSTPSDFLEMKVSEQGISVLHENTDTKRMNDVLADNVRKLKEQSTLTSVMSWQSELDCVSAGDDMLVTVEESNNPMTAESNNPMTATFSESENKSIRLSQDLSALKVD